MFSLQFANGVRLNGPLLLDVIEPTIINQCLRNISILPAHAISKQLLCVLIEMLYFRHCTLMGSSCIVLKMVICNLKLKLEYESLRDFVLTFNQLFPVSSPYETDFNDMWIYYTSMSPYALPSDGI